MRLSARITIYNVADENSFNCVELEFLFILLAFSFEILINFVSRFICRVFSTKSYRAFGFGTDFR